MQGPPVFFGDNKRYNNMSSHLRAVFGGKVCKLPVNGGFTCPNRDGAKGTGGCVYCSGKGGGEFAPEAGASIEEQLRAGRELLSRKWPGAGFIAYFQSFSNTYAPLEVLREKFERALSQPGILGLAVATRADCLPGEVADYLAELSRRTWLLVELGLQTVHDATGERVGRRHSFGEFLQGYGKLRERGIKTCVHLINYLPGETPEMMRESARRVGELRPHSVKIHMLYVQRGTPLAAQWERGEVELCAKEEYIALVCDQLELLPAEIVIQRLTGDADARELLAPLWTPDKRGTLNGIDKELRRRNAWQGRLAN